MNLTRFLILHAIVTFAAGVVLIVAPGAIPGTVDIPVNHQTNLLCYFLGVGEISLAVLSYFGRKLSDGQALQLICLTFIVFHLLTALVEIYAFIQGGSAKIWANVILRLLVTGLFIYYGLKIRQKNG